MELQEAIIARTEEVLQHVLRILGLRYELGILLMEAVGSTNWLFEYIRVREPGSTMNFAVVSAVEAMARIQDGDVRKDMTYEEVREFVADLFVHYFEEFMQDAGTKLLNQRKLAQE
jgi:hypothetical protein